VEASCSQVTCMLLTAAGVPGRLSVCCEGCGNLEVKCIVVCICWVGLQAVQVGMVKPE
jgi:hypothetical protein